MKPQAKRKNVQAQRKFAQGAIIPRNHNEQRRDSTTTEYLSPTIIRSIRVAMTASNLLDHITFRNLLPNMQPRVVLERLHCTVVKNKENENTEEPTPHTSRLTRSKSNSNSKTSTRSSLRNSKSKDKFCKKKQVTICDDFSFDDNQPLTFFTKHRNGIRAEQYETTQSQMNTKENNSIKENVTPQNLLKLSDDCQSVITIEYQHVADKQMDESSSFVQNMEHTTLADSGNTIDMLDNSTLLSMQSDVNSQNLDTSREVIDTSKVVDISKEVIDSSVVVIDTSVEVIDTSKGVTDESKEVTDTPKEVKATSKEIVVTQSEVQSTANILCPGMKYIKAKEVLSAPKDELNKRCQICKTCKTIDKLLYIATIVQQPLSMSQGESVDVYQFNGLDEENPPPLAMFTRNRRISNVGSNRDFIPVYLDILSNECTHVIQIMLNGDNNKILQARLVPKSLANANNELSLNDHRNLLDQLVTSLNKSNNRRLSEIRNGSVMDYETMVVHDARWWKLHFNTNKHRVLDSNSHGGDHYMHSVRTVFRSNGNVIDDPVEIGTEVPDRNSIVYILDESVFVQKQKNNESIPKKTVHNKNSQEDCELEIRYDTSDTDDFDTVIEKICDEPVAPIQAESATLSVTIPLHLKNVHSPGTNYQPCLDKMDIVDERDVPSFTEEELNQIVNDMCSEKVLVQKPIGSKRNRLSLIDSNKKHLRSSVQKTKKILDKQIKKSTNNRRKQSENTNTKTLLLKKGTAPNLLNVLQRRLSSKSSEKELKSSLISEPHSSHLVIPRMISHTNEEAETSKNCIESRIKTPKNLLKVKLVDALVFYPTKKEFTDPLAYFEKIMPTAQKFGLCKIVPPDNFKPTCYINDEMRFTVSNQYIARMYNRWGHAQREMCAIKVNSALQGVVFNRAPLMDCMEVNLMKLYHSVQRSGGYKKFTEEKCWTRITEELRLNQCPNPEKKLEYIYLKFLLSYYTLTYEERKNLLRKVDYHWQRNNKKMIERAINPLHRQKKLLCESESSDEDEDMDRTIACALAEAEECVAPGRQMNLGMFKKIAANMMHVHFPGNPKPSVEEVENEYWRIVLFAMDHVCVNTASVDTGPQGYGFTKNKTDLYGKHPWNLKVLSQNPSNVLRSLDQVLGVTVPTLHLGMVFSCSCWHRDPHGLPWMEYMHLGPGKIWYGIPDEQSDNFRQVVEKVCPTSYQNKSVWLPSDITMIPPKLLLENNVALSRIVQEPGEYIIVFPKAYSCSITTGYTQSESAYFATNSWLLSVDHVFQELRDSCEPSAFSLEQLLEKVACDSRASLVVLKRVHTILKTVVQDELGHRQTLTKMGVKNVNIDAYSRQRRNRGWSSRNEECEVCRTSLYFSKVIGIITKKSQVCLLHAVKLLEIPDYKVKPTQVEMILPFSADDLKGLITKIEDRLS